MVIADAGFWIALLDDRDEAHESALAAATLWDGEGFVTTNAVVGEACHLLRIRRHASAMAAFVRTLSMNGCRIVDVETADLPRAAALMRQYENLPMDYADASLVILAGRLGHGRILTTDRRDFGAYRWKRQHPFENLLEAP